MSNEHPTPEAIMQLTRAYAGSKALVGAVQLGLFTTLADGPLTVEGLRAKLRLRPRGSTDWLAGPPTRASASSTSGTASRPGSGTEQSVSSPIAALGGPSRPEPTFRDLHPEHLVLPQTKEEK
jgi:hypothetical protein